MELLFQKGLLNKVVEISNGNCSIVNENNNNKILDKNFNSFTFVINNKTSTL